MNDTFENLKALDASLLKDVLRCYQELQQSGTNEDYEFWARTMTGAVFAAIGGMCEFLCAQAFAAETKKVAAGEISPGKLSVLAGESYFVDDNGEIRAQPIRIRFIHQILFSLNAYAEAQGVPYRPQKDTLGWKNLKAAIVIRDNITHPKNVVALALTKSDMVEVKAAFGWFHNEIAEIMRAKGIAVPPMPPMP